MPNESVGKRPRAWPGIAAAMLLNGKVWEWIGRLSDVESVASLGSRFGPYAMTVLLWIRDWGWLPGLAWVVLVYVLPGQRWQRLLAPLSRLKFWQRRGLSDAEAQRLFGEQVREKIINGLSSAPDEADHARQRIRQLENERDGALQALARVKKNFALFQFRKFASDREAWKIRVTIRFATYDDYHLVEKIKKLVGEVGWPVDEDMANKPVIPPQTSPVKIVIKTEASEKLWGLASFIEDGELLPCDVALVGPHDGPNRNHIVFEILPTVNR